MQLCGLLSSLLALVKSILCCACPLTCATFPLQHSLLTRARKPSVSASSHELTVAPWLGVGRCAGLGWLEFAQVLCILSHVWKVLFLCSHLSPSALTFFSLHFHREGNITQISHLGQSMVSVSLSLSFSLFYCKQQIKKQQKNMNQNNQCVNCLRCTNVSFYEYFSKFVILL